MEKIDFYNLKINNFNTDETLSICQEFFRNEQNNLIFFVNAHCFNMAQNNAGYKNALNNVDLLLNDGIGIKLGAKMAGINIRENMNGTDFIPKLISLARKMEQNIYLLGGEEGIAQKAAETLKSKLDGLSIVGTRNGFFEFDDDGEVVDDIVSKNTDLLVVGMGVPRQELWLTKNKDKLKGVKISVAGGAVLDFISGKVERAPRWMQKTGIEWIFRLVQEPKRLFKRYFVGIPVFFLNILKLKRT